MNILQLVFAYLKHRPWLTLLNVLLLALGIATLTVMLLFAHQAEDRLRRDSKGVDLVIGAKGSPLQLILSTVYHIDVPNGNIKLADAETVLADPMVKRAIPLALGDSFQSFRIVGTGTAFLELQNAKLAEGVVWKQPLEAVLGAEAAKKTGLKIGARFIGSHGLGGGGEGHVHAPYTVTGILAPTGSVMDRLILTSVESVWKAHEYETPKPALADLLKGVLARDPNVAPKQESPPAQAKKDDHDHHDHDGHDHSAHSEPGKEVTAFLVQYASPLAVAVFPRMVQNTGALQAAQPAYETARLLSMMGFALDALRIFAGVLILASALGLFIALINALNERETDLALMRLLGASPARLAAQALAESMTLTLAGAILGLVLGHAATHLLGQWLEATRQVQMTGMLWLPEEWALIGGALVLGFLAALWPAWRISRQDVAPVLARR
ncbi:MAG: FtsX-like permease family protein [Betaproteobacteria bacterium]|nr:FtsX-like permease family protein [Betaproteobacteria bacterium]